MKHVNVKLDANGNQPTIRKLNAAAFAIKQIDRQAMFYLRQHLQETGKSPDRSTIGCGAIHYTLNEELDVVLTFEQVRVKPDYRDDVELGSVTFIFPTPN